MANIKLYTTDHCPYCVWAKQFLDTKQLPYEEIRVDTDTHKREEMERLSGRRTVPQIFINDQPIGGYDDMMKLSQSGELETLLK